MRDWIVHGARAAAVAPVALLLALLAWLLPSPGSQLARLALFGLIGLIGIVGAAGADRRRPGLVLAAGGGLSLLGFWQAVLGAVVVPVAGVLLITGLVLLGAAEDASPPDGGSADG